MMEPTGDFPDNFAIHLEGVTLDSGTYRAVQHGLDPDVLGPFRDHHVMVLPGSFPEWEVGREVEIGFSLLEPVTLGLKSLRIPQVGTRTATARVSLDKNAAQLTQVHMQYGPYGGTWSGTVTLDDARRGVVDFPLEGLAPKTEYVVRVSLDDAFPADETLERRFWTNSGLDYGPGGLTLEPYTGSNGNRGFKLTWAPPIVDQELVTGYQIVRHFEYGGQLYLWEPGTINVGPEATEYTDAGPLANGTYRYEVWATDERGPSRWRATAWATVTGGGFDPPAPPVNLTATNRPGSITLKWDHPGIDVAPVAPNHYVIEREVVGDRGAGGVRDQVTTIDDAAGRHLPPGQSGRGVGERRGLPGVFGGRPRLPQRAGRADGPLRPGRRSAHGARRRSEQRARHLGSPGAALRRG